MIKTKMILFSNLRKLKYENKRNPQLSLWVLELLRIFEGRHTQNAIKYAMQYDLYITFQIEYLGCYKPTPLE